MAPTIWNIYCCVYRLLFYNRVIFYVNLSVNILFSIFVFIFYFRLKIDNNGGAWCPKHMVSRGLKEYLQIDLLQMHVLTAIRTQGRFGKGQGQEYTEAYVVEYWRPGFVKWERWKNIQGKEVNKTV